MDSNDKSSIDWLIRQIEERKLTITWEWNGNVSCISSIKVPAFVREEATRMFKEEMRSIYLAHVTKSERLRTIFEKQFEELFNEIYGGNK